MAGTHFAFDRNKIYLKKRLLQSAYNWRRRHRYCGWAHNGPMRRSFGGMPSQHSRGCFVPPPPPTQSEAEREAARARHREQMKVVMDQIMAYGQSWQPTVNQGVNGGIDYLRSMGQVVAEALGNMGAFIDSLVESLSMCACAGIDVDVDVENNAGERERVPKEDKKNEENKDEPATEKQHDQV